MRAVYHQHRSAANLLHKTTYPVDCTLDACLQQDAVFLHHPRQGQHRTTGSCAKGPDAYGRHSYGCALLHAAQLSETGSVTSRDNNDKTYAV